MAAGSDASSIEVNGSAISTSSVVNGNGEIVASKVAPQAATAGRIGLDHVFKAKLQVEFTLL